jgi:hypothetical protein
VSRGCGHLFVAFVLVVIAGCGSPSATQSSPAPSGPAASVATSEIPHAQTPPGAASPSATSTTLPAPTAGATATTTPAASAAPTPSPAVVLKQILGTDHPMVAAAVVRAAVEAAVAKAIPDPLDPGMLAAVPRLLRDCLKPPEPYTMAIAHRCWYLAVAASNVYRDTADEAWYQATVASVNYLWNIEPSVRSPGIGNPAYELLRRFLKDEAPGPFSAARPTSPVPVRRSLIDIPHPATTLRTAQRGVLAALKASPPSASAAAMNADAALVKRYLEGCARPPTYGVDGESNNLAILDNCLRLAGSSYANYLDSGSNAWYAAARAAFNYTWNLSLNRADWWSAFFEAPVVREWLRDRLRTTVEYFLPKYIGQAP